MSEVEQFLRDAHRAAPGMTPRAFAGMLDDEGSTTYARLARLATEAGSDAVLDLACGDGFLLSAIAARAPASRLRGIDLSPDELALARAALPRAELVEGRVQALPWPDASTDLVTCHMAFMLFDAVDDVVAEIARVLAPGGRVGLIVGSVRQPVGVAPIYRRTFREYAAEVGATGLPIGDPRTRNPADLASLFEARFSSIECVDFDVRERVDAAGVWRAYEDMYNHAWLSPAQRLEFERRFKAAVPYDEQGRTENVHAVIELTAVRADDPRPADGEPRLA